MKVIVVGCGKIGTTIVESLVSEGHDVTAVDSNQDVTASLSNIYDVMCVTGNGTDYDTLLDAGTQNAELFVAVTAQDELNMLSCFIAKKMGAKHTVARIRNPEYNEKNLGFIKQQLDISLIINPEHLMAQEIFNILKLPSAANIETFSRRNFEMIELILKEDSVLHNVMLKDLRKKFSAKFLICVVSRDDKVYIPNGDFVLKAGDKIGLTAQTTEIQKLLKQMGVLKKHARNVMVLGASKTAFYLSRLLIKSGNNVKVLDINKTLCKEFSEILPEATVIYADGMQQEILLEEGLPSMDAFVALTGFDEQNILISYFAASQNVSKVIPKVNKNEFNSIASKMGIDTVVSAKRVVSDVVLRYARALQNSLGSSNIETLYKLMDNKTEALEFNVGNEIKFVNIPLKDINFKKDVLIAGILRGRKAIIPAGDDVIMPNDKVIIIAANQKINKLSDITEQ